MEIWIGIDGGGTKTELVAIGASEQIETNLTGRSSNPHAVGFEKAMAELTRLISEAVRTAPSAASAAAAPSAASGPSASASSSAAPAHLQGIALGLAGVSTPAERAAVTQALTSFLQEQGWSVPLLLRSEAEIALMAALGRPYGAAVIAGTGSIDEEGNVGAIGGIPQKLVGARRAGATVFLVPAANCAEALANAQPDLTLVRVETLAGAVAELEALRQGRQPTTC